jgi:hypothetical protein
MTRTETMVLPDDYLRSCDALLTQADKLNDADAAATRAEAQVKAIEAVAAAIEYLAGAVEALATR